jgi:hypothetical protein
MRVLTAPSMAPWRRVTARSWGASTCASTSRIRSAPRRNARLFTTPGSWIVAFPWSFAPSKLAVAVTPGITCSPREKGKVATSSSARSPASLERSQTRPSPPRLTAGAAATKSRGSRCRRDQRASISTPCTSRRSASTVTSLVRPARSRRSAWRSGSVPRSFPWSEAPSVSGTCGSKVRSSSGSIRTASTCPVTWSPSILALAPTVTPATFPWKPAHIFIGCPSASRRW